MTDKEKIINDLDMLLKNDNIVKNEKWRKSVSQILASSKLFMKIKGKFILQS
jgi:hypothetical protein